MTKFTQFVIPNNIENKVNTIVKTILKFWQKYFVARKFKISFSLVIVF